MIVRRALGILVAALLIPACGGGGGAPIVPLFSLDASGGSAHTDGTIDNGGTGGTVTLYSVGDIDLAAGNSPPTAPVAPAAPAGGTELTNAMITAGTPIAGNVRVSSTLQIAAGVNPAVVTTNTGDVIIAGTLIGERSAGTATRDIQINAPSGTIYVLGEIRTRGTPGTPDNPKGGTVTLTAQRVVVSGRIDTSGEASSTGVGGDGGPIAIDTTGGGGTDLLILGGSLFASGGAGTQGGKGGNVSLLAGALLAVFGPVTSNGGRADNLPNPAIGGNGGAATFRGNGAVDINADLSFRGGHAFGFIGGANGGTGGTFTAGSSAPYRIYGSLATAGGYASQHNDGPTGGGAGSVLIGTLATPVASLQFGAGPFGTYGGAVRLTAGPGGNIDATSRDGNIAVIGPLYTGAGYDVANNPAVGGHVQLITDNDAAGNTSNHTIKVSGSILTSQGGGGGGDAGLILLQGGGDITVNGTLDASGRAKFRKGATVTVEVKAVNLAPTGKISVTGAIDSEGSPPTPGISGGLAGAVALKAVQGLTFSGALTTRGFPAGSITLTTTSGTIDLSGTVNAATDPVYSIAYPAASITATTSGDILSSATFDASGASAVTNNSNVAGAAGGLISFTTTGAAGSIALLEGTLVRSNGGDSYTGSIHPSGGAGGKLTLTTVNGPVVLNGTYELRGGSNSADGGGNGGQVVVNTDSDANGSGGAITLAAKALIDVSAGMGFNGGSALNNGGVAPADSSGANLAVVFDAAGGLTSSPDGPLVGVIQNLGKIVATGNNVLGRGGDLWFDGKQPGGAELAPADAGDVTLTGPLGAGAFFPN